MIGVDGEGERDDVDCQEALSAMYLFLDKEQLTSEECAHIQAHLDDCIPCLESFEFEAELKQVVRKRCTDEVPQALYEKVRMSLRVEISSQAQVPETDT
jgi:mycothiol system anti-sigma-R factor